MMKKIMLLNAMFVGCVALQADMQPSKDVRPENLPVLSRAVHAVHNSHYYDGDINVLEISDEEAISLRKAAGGIATRKATDDFCKKQQASWAVFFNNKQACDLANICKKREVVYQNINTIDYELPLVFAARALRRKEIDQDNVQVLIDAGADVNGIGYKGYTPLLASVVNGPVEDVQALIRAGADVTVLNKQGHSLLVLAVDRHNVDIVKALIDAGADVNVTSSTHETLLEAAKKNAARKDRSAELIKMLEEAGAK